MDLATCGSHKCVFFSYLVQCFFFSLAYWATYEIMGRRPRCLWLIIKQHNTVFFLPRLNDESHIHTEKKPNQESSSEANRIKCLTCVFDDSDCCHRCCWLVVFFCLSSYASFFLLICVLPLCKLIQMRIQHDEYEIDLLKKFDIFMGGIGLTEMRFICSLHKNHSINLRKKHQRAMATVHNKKKDRMASEFESCMQNMRNFIPIGFKMHNFVYAHFFCVRLHFSRKSSENKYLHTFLYLS